MKKWIFLILLNFLVLPAFAQDVPPIIAIIGGNLYRLNPTNGETDKLTQHPDNPFEAVPNSRDDIYLSPDGAYLVYRRTPDFFAQAMNDNLIGNLGDTPTELILLNLATGEETYIRAQDAGVTWEQQQLHYYHPRSNGSWSPDGTQFVYLESRGYPSYAEQYPNPNTNVLIYDIASSESRTLVNLSITRGVWWTEHGIFVGNVLYAVNGEIISEYHPNGNTALSYYVHYRDEYYALVLNSSVTRPEGTIALFNLMTGEYRLVEGYMADVSLSHPETSLILLENEGSRPIAVLNREGEIIFRPPTTPPYSADYVLSPDGTQFAYDSVGAGLIVADGVGNAQEFDIETSGHMWGVKKRTIVQLEQDEASPVEPTDIFNTAAACGSLAPVGLIPGERGQVLSGSPNRIRRAPRADAEQIGQIPAGANFDVVNGQQGVCSDGIRWAQVSYDGVIGWTAEGAETTAFIKPVR